MMFKKGGPTYGAPQFRLSPILPQPRKLAATFHTEQMSAWISEDKILLIQWIFAYGTLSMLQELCQEAYKFRVFSPGKTRR